MLSARPLRASSAVTTRPRNFWRRLGRALVWLACLGFSANLLAAVLLHLEASLDKPSLDPRASLPNYQGVDWAKTHFREFAELVTVHHSYVGWRRLPYRGETIEIDDDGIRKTYADPSARPSKTIAFFGGSTMWGSGSDDEHTIPSAFAKTHPQYRAINFSETAHTAHQNLNALVQVLAGGLEPDVVVFYNGSSEINKCRVGLSAFSTTEEPEIRQLLERERRGFQTGEALWSIFHPVKVFSDRLQRSLAARLHGGIEQHDCVTDPGKAEAIARTLLWDWLAAKRLVEGYGGRFIAALQPVAYFSQTRIDHIDLDQYLREQYQAVYPNYDRLIRHFPALESNFLDLRGAFDRDEYIYIDADHAGPNGNAIVAAAIGEFLSR
jgi:hypothetical protein